MPDPPFISTADLTAYIGRDVTGDAGGTIVVDAACQACRTLAEQHFNAGTSTVTLDGTGTDALLLPELPVTNVGTVTVAGSAIDNFRLSAEHGILYRTVGSAVASSELTSVLRWPEGRQNVQVTYSHGYGTVPSDVRMVALAIAARLAIQGVAQSETVGDVSMRYAVAPSDFSNGELAILRKYRPR